MKGWVPGPRRGPRKTMTWDTGCCGREFPSAIFPAWWSSIVPGAVPGSKWTFIAITGSGRGRFTASMCGGETSTWRRGWRRASGTPAGTPRERRFWGEATTCAPPSPSPAGWRTDFCEPSSFPWGAPRRPCRWKGHERCGFDGERVLPGGARSPARRPAHLPSPGLAVRLPDAPGDRSGAENPGRLPQWQGGAGHSGRGMQIQALSGALLPKGLPLCGNRPEDLSRGRGEGRRPGPALRLRDVRSGALHAGPLPSIRLSEGSGGVRAGYPHRGPDHPDYHRYLAPSTVGEAAPLESAGAGGSPCGVWRGEGRGERRLLAAGPAADERGTGPGRGGSPGAPLSASRRMAVPAVERNLSGHQCPRAGL